MRRGVLALLFVLPLAACGTDRTGLDGQPAVAGSLASVAADTKTACEAVGAAYTKNIGPFAEAVTKLTPAGTAADRKAAQQRLGDFATSIRTATEKSADPRIVADGKATADALKAKASDPAVFAAIKTPQDASTLLGPTLKQWLSPINHHCS
ncbi:hypothetical protein ACQP2F_26795 [Actinoplanes sp. CA-030573]|uniref:hypothetical protein n=1 Tax=Actinoplanes sp. CA-030573 TaxID=3239898 RepID=UPI003D8D49CA